MMVKKKIGLTLMALAVTAAMLPAVSQAGFVAGGNTNIASGQLPPDIHFDGTFNFAVYRRVSGTYGLGGAEAAFLGASVNGTGSSDFDALGFATPQEYLYLYQAVNNGPDTAPPTDAHGIGFVNVDLLDSASVGAWGYFTGYGLEDSEGVVSAANDYGSNSVDSDFMNNAPLTLDGTPGSLHVVPNAGLTPTFVNKSGEIFEAYFSSRIGVGASSVIIGFTSSKGPYFSGVTLTNTGESGNGTTLGPQIQGGPTVPAPTGLMALASLATVGFGAFYRRRRAVK